MVYLHKDGVEGIAGDMRTLLSDDLEKNLNVSLYELGEKYMPQQSQPSRSMNVLPKTEIAQTVMVAQKEEKPEIEPPVMTLYDLFGFTEEERKMAESGTKRRKSRSSSKTVKQPSLFSQSAAEPIKVEKTKVKDCLLYTSPSPRD